MPEADDNDLQSETAAGLPAQPVEEASGATPLDDVPELTEPLAEDGPEVAQAPVELAEAVQPAEDADAAPPQPTAEPAPADTTHVSAPEAPDAALVEGVSGGVTWIPFAVYLAGWIVLAGLSAYFLQGATPESPAQWMPAYEPLLWGGIGLTALGPLMSLGVWLVARAARPSEARRGLFSSVMTRGALATFFGVLIWVGTLYVLELLGSGWAL